ncbi:hypothetical protein [Lysinibacillus fusiformis]|uniref:Uncharacterized protein n=1 Tax=Lysinibacillus fusiformis TaxID=28031 RepID=A0A1H9AZE9_9BACI|nr:hypothetical protein [Lysinibacillus fusiformis]SCX81607.1 hypothetical protein SAMN02787081_00114 [Lysinibacillus fusiformis]SEM76112.1 hypothetical protein SAMN02787103_00114 [Lysinibacillus fusiformis]SEP81813.1 hypothetical protein SAMN02787113_00644 [Lysinibacillus fusiformis]
MTKTNIEILDELMEKGYTLVRKNPTSIAIEFKQDYYAEVDKIKRDRDLTPAAKAYKQEQLQEKHGKRLFEVLAEQKAEYKKTAEQARKLAQTIRTMRHSKPSDDLQNKLFQQEIESLKTSTMLGTNAKGSMEAINAFVDKYGNEPYYAEYVTDIFPVLAGNVLGIEDTPQNRHSLSKLLERITEKATTDEQRKAKETLGFFGDGDVKFYPEGLTPYNAIQQIIGRDAARYLNEPERAIELISTAE